MTLDVILLTGRTFRQAEAAETGKDLDIYTKAVAICELDPDDMKRLGAREDDVVRVSTGAGEVFVRAVKSGHSPHEGIAFIPVGPWANAIIDFGTDSTGMPSFKGVKAKVELAKGRKVLSAMELARSYLKKEGN